MMVQVVYIYCRIHSAVCCLLLFKKTMSLNAKFLKPKKTAEIDGVNKWLYNTDKIKISKIIYSWLRFQKCAPETEQVYNFDQLNHLKTLNEKMAVSNKYKKTFAINGVYQFEELDKKIFKNKSSLKLANVDSKVGFLLSKARVKDELLYFADISGGEGGFADYMFYRNGWCSKGFGITKRNNLDYKLDNFWCGVPYNFNVYYGSCDDGDVEKPDNANSFINYIKDATNGNGVDVVLSNGGGCFKYGESCDGLYISQAAIAVSILKVGGTALFKMHDITSKISIELLYILYKIFVKILIIKPETSKPTNSEVFIICDKLINHSMDEFLLFVQGCLYNEKEMQLISMVSPKVIKWDESFYSYITEVNNRLISEQITCLELAFDIYDDKLLPFTKNNLDEYITSWNAVGCRKKFEPRDPDLYIRDLLNVWDFNIFFSSIPNKFDDEDGDFIKNEKYWMVYETNLTCRFFMSSGTESWTFNGKEKKWYTVNLKLPRHTIFLGETEGDNVAIVDAIFLGGEDVRNLPFDERRIKCNTFSQAFNLNYKMMVPLSIIRPHLNYPPFKNMTLLFLRCLKPNLSFIEPEGNEMYDSSRNVVFDKTNLYNENLIFASFLSVYFCNIRTLNCPEINLFS